MKIGIIGTGMVGSSLGEVFTRKNHEVMFGSRNPESAKEKLSKSIKNVKVGTYGDTTKFADILVLAVHWDHVEDTLKKMGNLNGKIIIDCVNPLSPDLKTLKVGRTTSSAEEIAKLAKNAKIVKAFNAIGAETYKNPVFGTQKASAFICGDDKEVKEIITKLIDEVGFEVIDTGPLSSARLLEPLAGLWVDLAYVQKLGPNIAFKLLKR
jgi:NADPH-dependent F420 reductase